MQRSITHYPSTTQSVETMTLPPLVSMPNDFLPYTIYPGSHQGARSLSMSSSVTPGMVLSLINPYFPGGKLLFRAYWPLMNTGQGTPSVDNKSSCGGPVWVVPVVAAPPNMPRLRVPSPVRAHIRINQWYINKWTNKSVISLYLSLPPSLPLSLSLSIST